MKSVLHSRACTLFVVFAGLGIGACTAPSGPSAVRTGNLAQGEELGPLAARDVPAVLKGSALAHGVTDGTLANAGWSCIEPGPGVIVCAPPGMGLPSIPPVPDNGGAPSYTLAAFVDHQFDHHVKFLRPDLYRGQPCLGGEPWHYFALLDYYECIIPVR